MKLFPPTFTAHQRRRGMTLVELLIAIAIGTLVFAAVASFSIFTARSFVAAGNYADLDRASFIALDTLSRDIRECRGLEAGFTSNKLPLIANDGSELVYEYHPSTREFTREQHGLTSVLLSQCDYLNFAVYQRTPAAGWNWYPVDSTPGVTSEPKLVDVSWKCSRTILGLKVNTESVQTAKVVIRN